MEAAEILLDGSWPAAMAVAFGWGLLALVSAGTLAVLPGFVPAAAAVSLDAETGDGRRTQSLLALAVLSLGFVVVVVFLGTGRIFSLVSDPALLTRLGGAVVVVVGVGVIAASMRRSAGLDRLGPAVSIVLGMALGLAWNPSIGPVLSAILSLAAADETATRGTVLVVAFAVGIGSALLAVDVAVRWLLGRFGGHARVIGSISGMLLVVYGLVVAAGLVSWLEHQMAVLLQGLGLEGLVSI